MQLCLSSTASSISLYIYVKKKNDKRKKEKNIYFNLLGSVNKVYDDVHGIEETPKHIDDEKHNVSTAVDACIINP